MNIKIFYYKYKRIRMVLKYLLYNKCLQIKVVIWVKNFGKMYKGKDLNYSENRYNVDIELGGVGDPNAWILNRKELYP